ncbi:MAG: alanine racemase [Candidatus Borkfalkiaceae bacterium]|nr:alanine racemase [Clostridia bacterium]MDY6223238.1 alanine racemase [Christensenellaceae bacterium]
MQKTIAEISLRTIENNALFFKRRTGVKLCAVVKDDAYGHGAAEVAEALSGIADCFAVANADEAATLRATTGKDILVLTPPATEEEAIEIVLRGCILSVNGPSSACAAAAAGKFARKFGAAKARVHLKANTGMNRYGCRGAAFTRTCEILKNANDVSVEGVFSHLACAEDLAFARRQREEFINLCGMAERYFPGLIRHLSATAGACLSGEFYFDMVRIGIGLYGYPPLETIRRNTENGVYGASDGLKNGGFSAVKPAMKVYARAVQNNIYRFGRIGYGCLSGTDGEKLHVINAGYGNGFFRKVSNGMSGGDNAATPCMDASIRYGAVPRGRRVCVMKNAEETARAAGTIAYEVLCMAGKNAERVYI